MHWDAETEALAHKHPFCAPASKLQCKPADEGFVQHIRRSDPKWSYYTFTDLLGGYNESLLVHGFIIWGFKNNCKYPWRSNLIADAALSRRLVPMTS